MSPSSSAAPLSPADETRQLRAQLSALLAHAQRNQQIMERHQALDLQLIGATGFVELIDVIFNTLKASSDLDVVTLTLIDPAYDIRRILADLAIRLDTLPHLLFIQDENELGELHAQLTAPLLGDYREHLHRPVFPEPVEMPASVAVVPLIRNRRLMGCLALGSSDAERFSPQMATDFVTHLASIIVICIENVISQERLKYLGLTDPLTGVNNRRYVERRLNEEVGRSCRQGYALSCMYIDIDHFKQINDRVGHQAGDDVLRQVAARIKAELRLSDALGRFGGEEFVVLLIDSEVKDAVGVAERVRGGICEQAVILADGARLDVTVSIGVASLGDAARAARTDSEVDALARQLVGNADRALYRAKAEGRNRVAAAA
jgi:two-component system, cell cycle response regulator